MEKSILYALVAASIYVSHDIGHNWPNEEHVRGVCDHTRPFMIVYTSDMCSYIEYVEIFIFIY